MKAGIFALVLVMLMGFGCPDQVAKQQQSDAYICGEPPDEVTFYCRTGTGPPRTDCSAPQPGMYDKDPQIC